MVLARSALAKSGLSAQMRRSTAVATLAPRLTKTYRALVGPSDLPETFVVMTPIGKVPYPVLGAVYAATPQGKAAHSEGRVLKRHKAHTLLEMTIRTGRPHQIRIHLAAVGYPLVNDPLYAPGGLPYPVTDLNGIPVPGDCGYWLHAHRLRLMHPRTGEVVEFVCEPPDRLDYSVEAES